MHNNDNVDNTTTKKQANTHVWHLDDNDKQTALLGNHIFIA